MLGFNPYYHRTIRKLVIAFGSIFNDISMVTRTNDTQTEIKRITVPLSYAGKENFLTRLLDNPDLAKPVEITLPRMAFIITGYTYDPSRKLVSTQQMNIPGTVNTIAQSLYNPVPWNIDFELSLYVRNREDGLQVIEQILPFFTPDYTPTIQYIPELGISRNAPIILNGVQCAEDYEGVAKEQERTIVWTLGFTMQAYLYGPVSNSKTITSTNTNIFINTSLGGAGGLASDIELILANTGLGTFTQNEPVYQGANLPDATVVGYVSTWDAAAHVLTLSGVQGGAFVAGANVTGANSFASWGVAQTTPDIKMANIKVTPNPANANSSNDFGFTTVITEYPNTLTIP